MLRKGIGGILILVGFAILGFSLPANWALIELVNQEYLHWWQVDYTVYEIKFNGESYTNKEAIVHLAILTIVMWGLASILLLTGWWFIFWMGRAESTRAP